MKGGGETSRRPNTHLKSEGHTERRWPEAEGDVEGVSGVARHVQWAPVPGVDSEKMLVVFGGPAQNGEGARLLGKKEAAGARAHSLPRKRGRSRLCRPVSELKQNSLWSVTMT